MGLIKPGLGRVCAVSVAREEAEADTAPAETPGQLPLPSVRPRRSRLAMRTAALLQRLHAQQHSAAIAATPGPESMCDADLNRIHLTGVLAREPLLADVGDHPVATLALVSERRWRTSGGGTQIEANSFHLMAWEELAEHCGRLLHRGDQIYVEGALHLCSPSEGQQSVQRRGKLGPGDN